MAFKYGQFKTPKPTYKPERVKKVSVAKANAYIGPDWWNPPREYLDQNGKLLGEKAKVKSHLCFSPMTCAGVRDTDPIVVLGLRSVTSLHDQSSVVYDKEREEQVCQSCKNPGESCHTPHIDSSPHSEETLHQVA